MKISELIKVFEALLPIYKKAYKEKWSLGELHDKDLDLGLCHASEYILKVSLHEVMDKNKGYYKNNLTYELNHCFGSSWYLFKPVEKWQDLKSRIDFMESEIKDLKRLIKKGYTHL